MTIKAVLTDLDGTLIDFNGLYDKKVPSLIQELKQNNINVSLATGRAYFGDVSRIVKELDLSPLTIVNGGGMIINHMTGEAPWHKPLSDESARYIVDYLIKTNYIFSLETKEDAYMMKIVPTRAYPHDFVVHAFNKADLPKQILKILVHGMANKLPEIEIDKHINNIKDKCKDISVMKFAYKEYFGIDFTSEGATKHTAVLEYAKTLGISPREIIAVGDGFNDYPLFTACGYTIAMGSAPKELKDIADIIVSRSADGGMREALEHIIFLMK